jgi:hypothetical protein
MFDRAGSLDRLARHGLWELNFDCIRVDRLSEVTGPRGRGGELFFYLFETIYGRKKKDGRVKRGYLCIILFTSWGTTQALGRETIRPEWIYDVQSWVAHEPITEAKFSKLMARNDPDRVLQRLAELG